MCYKIKYMIIEFTHPELGQEVQTFTGYYIPIEEHIIPYNEREVIYILGHACIEASCCGPARWSYIQVLGFLVRKHIRGGKGTSPVSEIEIIKGEEDRDTIRQSLMKKYPNARIEIW
jgi:hypothetical protein